MALRVLLADESSTIKRVMQLALQDFGVEVKSVPVGLDVLPVTKTFQPDIIFADVLLAKRNGYEICAELKADAETQKIPVILMWSSFMEVDEAKISAAGPDARLEKPFDAEALRQIVQDLVPKTQNNPISAYLQFPKMPEFKETPASSAPAARKIPDAAPINFDQFDPTANEDESIFSIPEEDTDSSMLTRSGEEFAAVPLNSSQQKDPLEEDGWQRQDLNKFKIEIPKQMPSGSSGDEDFAQKFVIPQDDFGNAHVEVEGEFEEIHFDSSKTVAKAAAPKGASAAATTDAEMMERIIREEAREVIESICWKVIPEMAERIVREEIQKILRDVEKST